jgi:hypothetical protein
MSTGSDAHLGTWLAVGVLIGLAVALLIGVVAAGVRRARRAPGSGPQPRHAAAAPPADRGPAAGPDAGAGTFELDDLPGFAEQPPGSAAGHQSLPPPTPAVGTVGPPEPAAPDGGEGRRRGTSTDLGGAGTATVAVALLLLVAAVLVAWAGGGPVASARSQDAAPVGTPPVRPTPSSSAAPPTPTASGAAALALESVPLGADGVAAGVTFSGVVLEQRAIGLTVTYPSVSLSTDGRRSLAHVRLPTFNCLTADPPADPAAAGCARSLTEYADLADPALTVSWDGDRIELAGLFPTYTRPNGSAPAYTGRAYQLAVTITAEGPERDGAVPAAGVVRIGLDSAPTSADGGVNLLQRP